MKYLYHPEAFSPSNWAKSYWMDSAPEIAPFPALDKDDSCEIAVIGSGYSGMMAAYHLQQRHGVEVRVLEAAQPGWGASGRNGGFCCMGAAKLSYQQIIGRYGLDNARAFFQIQKESVAFVGSFLDEHQIAADQTGQGEISLAHKASIMEDFRREQNFLRSTFTHETHLLTADQLKEQGLKSSLFGGLHNPVGFGLHPLKYARGLAEELRQKNVKIYGDSPVLRWRRDGKYHILQTPNGSLKATQVVLATNGYTPEDLSEDARGKLLPALSSILVTRPLSEIEIKQQGWHSTTTVYDSRILLHYFRLLPDGRFLFGGRGGTDASPEGRQAAEKHLRYDFEKMFPEWASVEHTHFWQGFVCLTNDLIPYIGPLNMDRSAWAALAYHGNGVAMASWAGQALADEIVGKDKGRSSALPAMLNRNFSRFPLPPLRLAYLKAAYLYYQLKDEWF
ncbi:NAD(P)/FAD-dependent oxidoreductase [Kiloniella laminariae]|uniref:NAD(P)/FAD-dependent oxidoreductase n=1 Tax=Kiloniella laminariae TaxID=454162 RepID=UPI00047590EC|nr:FAD-binding oxidoreductase [Kiloniella laminariae]